MSIIARNRMTNCLIPPRTRRAANYCKFIVLPALIFSSLITALACGGDSTTQETAKLGAPAEPTILAQSPAGTSETNSGPAIAPELQENASKRASSIEGGPRQGGTFHRTWGDPPTLDPHLVTDTTSAGIVVEIFSGLVTLNQDLQIVPDLAESWDIEDGKTYTFKLREGVRFSDGTPVKAIDFKWSLERAAHPDTESPVAEVYLGDIVGAQDVIEGRGAITEINGIQIIDDRTLRVDIDAPKAYFLAKLTYPTAFVLKRDNVISGGENWTDNAVGTGPFILDEYRIGQRIVLKRNDNYWDRSAYLDRVEFNLAGGVPMAMYENDEIDFTGVGLADLERVQNPEEPLNKELVRVPPSFSVSYMGFNVKKPPFDDVKFRQALNHAVDKDLIADQVYSNLVTPAYGILPPNFPGYSENIMGLKFEPELARELLAASKYADPTSRPRIVVTIPGTGGSPSLDLEVVADMWQKVLDVNIEIEQVEWATYLQDLNRRRLQAWGGLGWAADYPDPQDFIDILFHSESPGNHGAYVNEDVNTLTEKARIEQDVVQRVSLYNRAEQIILDDAAWLPLWFDTEGLALVKSYIKGYRFTPIIVPKLKDVWVDN